MRSWNEQSKPQTIIIALHGIGGAARDFGRLGRALPQESRRTALYALNLRGLGYDSDAEARGDIADSKLWLRDLEEFHRVLAAKYPSAKMVWLGESMGGIVALHTVANGVARPDKLILASPVTSLKTVPAWQRAALVLASSTVPRARIALEELAGGDFQATEGTTHFAQSQKNPWYVERFTLRFMRSLARMADQMPAKAAASTAPVLILQGGRDFLSPPEDGRNFAKQFRTPVERKVFPQSRHLLFYDKEKNEVITEILRWLD